MTDTQTKPLSDDELKRVRHGATFLDPGGHWVPWQFTIKRLLATIDMLQQYQPLPTAPHDPKSVAELAALTDEQIVERLRGIYRIPVNDGAGPLNGSTEFVREFFTGAIQHEAARRIEALLHPYPGNSQ